MKNKIFLGLKAIYKKLPINYKTKNKLKGIFYRVFGFLLKDTTSYRVWNALNTRIVRDDIVSVDDKEAESFVCNSKIAVQLHLYYVELLEEFVSYFKNIPYDFDVLVSIVDSKEKDRVKAQFEMIENVKQVYVEVVANRGRDVAPLLCVFGDKIMEYDYVCHIHSKKSLFTGREQSEWRKHLLDGLMGTSLTVKKHFYLLEKGEKVGLLYPETFPEMPYIGHTWLKNAGSRDELLERINVQVKSKDVYIDYPMGTMFWAKVDAIRPFFQAKLRVDEFPKEGGQKDGTIAHAFERCLPVVCQYQEYNYVIFDAKQESYSYNWGLKNLNQYYVKEYEGMKQELASYDVISFDIFDTLIARKISNPKGILDLVELKLNKKYNQQTEFQKLRLQAELQWRRLHPEKDCGLEAIYGELKKITGWNSDMLDSACKLEVETEILVSSKKDKVCEVLAYEKQELNKNIYLISDMQLGEKEIRRMFDKNKIAYEGEIYVSSDMDLRKDNGTMWEYFCGQTEGKTKIHVGDNEMSDVQIPGDYDIKNYHLMSNLALYQTSNIGRCVGNLDDRNAADAVAFGLILERVFSDPLCYNMSQGNVKELDAATCGYVFFGPTVLNYLLWIVKEARDNGWKKILFCAREGYVMKLAYDALCKVSGISIPADYVYVSRRALSFAAIENEEDLGLPLDIYYEGKLRNLLESRYGICDTQVPDEDIKLPDNKGKVLKYLQPWKEEILKNAAVQRENYQKYFRSVLPDVRDGKIGLADIGYSGTIQYYLSKITKRGYEGRYMATDNRKKPLELPENTIEGYYIDNDGEQEISVSNIHKYHLILESVMIAEDGQLLYIDSDGKPVFDGDGNSLYTEEIRQMQEAIAEYAGDYAGIMENVILEQLPKKELAERLMYCLVKEKPIGNPVADAMKVDDRYCSGKIRNAIDYYREGNKR